MVGFWNKLCEQIAFPLFPNMNQFPSGMRKKTLFEPRDREALVLIFTIILLSVPFPHLSLA